MYRAALLLAAGLMSAGMSACSQGNNQENQSSESKAEDGSKESSEAKENDEKKQKAESEAKEAEAYKSMSAEDLIKNYLNKSELSDEDYMELISTYRFVPIDEKNLTLEENPTSKAFQLLKDKQIKYICSSDSLKKLLASEYPQLRREGFINIFTPWEIPAQDLAAAKEALKTEKEPYVIVAALDSLGNEGVRDSDIGAFILESAENENPNVRAAAAHALCSYYNSELEGGAEAVLTLMQDKDETVAQAACKECGGLYNASFIEPLKNILNDDAAYKLHSACLDSLEQMWFDYPSHEHASDAAYHVYMDYFKKTPRNKDIPANPGISILAMNKDNFDAWKTKATYYDPAEINSAMTEILKDPEANWMLRSKAIGIIHVHSGKEALEALKPVIDGLSDKEAKLIQDSYNRELEKANKEAQ